MEEQGELQPLVAALTDRCVREEHHRSCERLAEVLDLGAGFAVVESPDSPAPSSPPPTQQSCVCWDAGPAVRAAGVSTTTSGLSVHEVLDIYAEIVRGLPHGALAVADLPAAVRTAVDLNSDLIFSRFEVHVGLTRVVHPRHWHEQLLEQLWTPSPCDCAPPPPP